MKIKNRISVIDLLLLDNNGFRMESLSYTKNTVVLQSNSLFILSDICRRHKFFVGDLTIKTR